MSHRTKVMLLGTLIAGLSYPLWYLILFKMGVSLAEESFLITIIIGFTSGVGASMLASKVFPEPAISADKKAKQDDK